ncbi:YybH family protein [Phaeodactylibacter luteus]|uniref:YybH family protein n=1 Tax=Phaeodactylibacter luteus TaxID=1564516 RepID=UPI001478D3A6|nr:SgcJ/EcaC family oxidoreductase [Phaeodactylibacter luteus]
MKSSLNAEATAEILEAIDAFQTAWNEKNLERFLHLFTEDAAFTDVVGQTAVGKKGIREQHEFAFGVVMKNASLEISNLLILEIAQGIAMATANWINRNSQTPDGRPLPERNGVIQFILLKTNQGWRFKIVHNADFALPYQKQERTIR